MDSFVTLYLHRNTQKISSFSSSSAVSLVLNIILLIVSFVFIICSFHFVHHHQQQEPPVDVIKPPRPATVLPVQSVPPRTYYDFEQYPLDISLERTRNISRRCFYIDVGCFDGRDVDFFIHFHLPEISRYGKLSVITFEPDPINFSACKASQQRHTDIDHAFVDAAVWNKTGTVPYATEKGQRSKIDFQSVLQVRSVDFSQWLLANFTVDDFIYMKFTAEGADIPVLEKMVADGSLALVDYLELEWNDGSSPDLEPRRVSLECMFDNFGMDFLYMVSPVDLKHAFNAHESFYSVPKNKGWKLNDSSLRFHYKTRKDVADLVVERYKEKQQQQQQQ